MVLVTDLQYSMERAVADKLYDLCKRSVGKNKHQNVIITDGVEGFGKSTLTSEQAYFMANVMKRKLKLFFDVEKLISYAVRSEDEIFIWDDAAFAALSVQAYNKVILKLIKTIWLARKKRHTIFINIQEIFRMKELIVSRAICLNHVYSRDDITVGRYVFYTKNKIQALYSKWQKSKLKLYKKYYSLRGSFPDALGKIFNEVEYDTLKDHAILSIDDEGVDEKSKLLEQLKHTYATLEGVSNLDKANHAGVTDRTIRTWKNLNQNHSNKGYIVATEMESGNKIINKGYIEPSNQDYLNRPSNRLLTAPMLIKDRPKIITSLQDAYTEND